MQVVIKLYCIVVLWSSYVADAGPGSRLVGFHFTVLLDMSCVSKGFFKPFVATFLAQAKRKAKNLKQADTEASRHVYIVPDKTPKESEKYRELPKELEERKDKGETDLMIRDMKVVKRRDGRQRVTDGKEVSKKANQGKEAGVKVTSERRSYSHVLVPPNGQKQ